MQQPLYFYLLAADDGAAYVFICFCFTLSKAMSWLRFSQTSVLCLFHNSHPAARVRQFLKYPRRSGSPLGTILQAYSKWAGLRRWKWPNDKRTYAKGPLWQYDILFYVRSKRLVQAFRTIILSRCRIKTDAGESCNPSGSAKRGADNRHGNTVGDVSTAGVTAACGAAGACSAWTAVSACGSFCVSAAAIRHTSVRQWFKSFYTILVQYIWH